MKIENLEIRSFTSERGKLVIDLRKHEGNGMAVKVTIFIDTDNYKGELPSIEEIDSIKNHYLDLSLVK